MIARHRERRYRTRRHESQGTRSRITGTGDKHYSCARLKFVPEKAAVRGKQLLTQGSGDQSWSTRRKGKTSTALSLSISYQDIGGPAPLGLTLKVAWPNITPFFCYNAYSCSEACHSVYEPSESAIMTSHNTSSHSRGTSDLKCLPNSRSWLRKIVSCPIADSGTNTPSSQQSRPFQNSKFFRPSNHHRVNQCPPPPPPHLPAKNYTSTHLLHQHIDDHYYSLDRHASHKGVSVPRFDIREGPDAFYLEENFLVSHTWVTSSASSSETKHLS